jgi:hypothetical protein
MLAGLPLEKQVVEILLEEDALMPREEVRQRLIPRPALDAFAGLISRLGMRNHIAEFPSGDPNALIGLPGWAITKPKYKPQAPPPVQLPAPVVSVKAEADSTAAPQLPSPSMETTMPKKSRIPKEQADDAVEAAIHSEGSTFTAIMTTTELPRSAVNAAIVRLKKASRVHSIGKGRATLWHRGAKNAAAQPPSEPGRAQPRKPNGDGRRFGYFSDGSLSLDCEACKGTLTAADITALREFTEEHVK